jgi:hypothetical protein
MYCAAHDIRLTTACRPVRARPEIWLTGLRNLWRMRPTPDRRPGIGDARRGDWEEIDVARAK